MPRHVQRRHSRFPLQRRDSSAEALLSDRQGWVEGQKPQEIVWSDRSLNTILTEQEKVRTLSNSSAQITFRDNGRLRLNANSQAVILRMRVDPLSRREEAKVSLIEGDFYTALPGKSQRKTFELQIPEVQTEIASRNFWVRSDAAGSKFANYDGEVLRIAAKDESVDLGRNEAVLVRRGKAPSEKKEVLPPAQLRAPDDDFIVFNVQLSLQWNPVADAAGYWLEVARDPGFDRMMLSRWGLADTRFAIDRLEIGTFYWRVVALDKFGLPGVRSDVRRFHVRVDRTPPYLIILEPRESDIIRNNRLLLRGESEAGAGVEFAGKTLALRPDGSFEAEIEAKPGTNRVVVAARDQAGNVTHRERTFFYSPDERALVLFDEGIPRLTPRHFVTNRDVVSLAGRAKPNAQILIRSDGGQERAAAYTDGAGRFTVNVAVQQQTELFRLSVVERSGFVLDDQFDVTIDRVPPRITFDAPPPAATAVEWLSLRGTAEGATGLAVNGRPAQLLDDRFEITVTLTEGANGIELVATDLVGNLRALKVEIALDQTPPALIRHAVSKDRVSGGEPVIVDVYAQDASGLKRTAAFTLQVGGRELADLLYWNDAASSYRGTFNLPKQASGSVALKDVELEDYVGNKTRYTLK